VIGKIKRRTEVVGIICSEPSCWTKNDEWAMQRAHNMTLEIIPPINDHPFVSLSALAS
jgi:hypothetical protein